MNNFCKFLKIAPVAIFEFSTFAAHASGLPAVPDIHVARDFLHYHTDLNCDTRENPKLVDADRAVVISQLGQSITAIFDLYCSNSGAQTTRVFLKWNSADPRFELLHFAQPVYEIVYESEERQVELAQPVPVKGYESFSAIENAVFESEHGTITSQIPWGLQLDAGSTAVWQWSFSTSRFYLISFVIDPFHEANLTLQDRAAWRYEAIRLFPSH